MYDNLNLGNSIFKGLNDKHGLVICGYEYGWSKSDQAEYERREAEGLSYPDKNEVTFTFANKELFLGEHYWKIPYDNRIAKWFELWNHPLNRDGLGDDFTKSIMQTNISNTQNNAVEDYEEIARGVDDFVEFLKVLSPSVILFMGRKNSDFINRADNLPKIESVLGKSKPRDIQRAETDGRKFDVVFQDFENCRTVTLPHPSNYQYGLSDEYIASFKPQLDDILSEYKVKRGF